MRLSLKNGTSYPDVELKAVLQQVLEHHERWHGRRRVVRPPGVGERWRSLVVVHVVYAKGSRSEHRHVHAERGVCSSYSGSAHLFGLKATLRVPRETCDAQSLAALWLHELWHLYGVNHRDFTQAVMHCEIATVAPYVDSRAFDEVAPAPPPRVSADVLVARRAERREKAVARLLKRRAAWARKLSRAETALRKIDRSLAGYERRAISVGQVPEV